MVRNVVGGAGWGGYVGYGRYPGVEVCMIHVLRGGVVGEYRVSGTNMG